jgi:glycine cleavage system P protein (glycine dehydrogenase) subunit 2
MTAIGEAVSAQGGELLDAGAPDGTAPSAAGHAVAVNLQPTLAELSRPGRGGAKVPHPPADALARLPSAHLRREPLALPELAEPEVMRHFVNLSQLNYAVDTGFYPLGSCTMKYNPKINESAARLRGAASPGT